MNAQRAMRACGWPVLDFLVDSQLGGFRQLERLFRSSRQLEQAGSGPMVVGITKEGVVASFSVSHLCILSHRQGAMINEGRW